MNGNLASRGDRPSIYISLFDFLRGEGDFILFKLIPLPATISCRLLFPFPIKSMLYRYIALGGADC